MKNVAVFVPNRDQFGNITTQIPMLYALQKQHPEVYITVYTRSGNSQVLVDAGVADDLINYQGWNFLKVLKSLNRGGYDAVFNVYSGSERIHLAVLASRVPDKYAFSDSGLIHKLSLYTQHMLVDKGQQYIAINNLELANVALGTDFDTTIIKELGRGVSGEKTCLTLVPGGGAGAFKVWPVEKYCEAAKQIFDDADNIRRIGVVLGPQEAQKAGQIGELLAGYPYDIIVSPPVRELIDLANVSALTLSNDCGPCHIFQMMKVPMIMIWGWQMNPDQCRSPYHTLTDWYQNSDDSWCVFPTESEKKIATISVERVTSLSLMQLARNTLTVQP
ncbi:glycosyltransferase family 9 protein [Aliamphritea hakodatensis]|uniref:glycosyltransferase family 9 protein n=1 Tax=Aliamphritea hakodatensis TaxID=2895352 RepID=UPI0022FD4EE1|nr:glycosyltransferase family 9 protein [Aliamphritea hakodatensis]